MSTEALGASELPPIRLRRRPLPDAVARSATKELPEFAHLRAHVHRLSKRDERLAPSAGVEPAAAG